MARAVAVSFAVAAVAVAARVASGGGPGARTKITIWTPSGAGAFGGLGYGGSSSGALITEPREIEVGAGGEVRITNVAATIDPASVQLRDATEPGAAIAEQRFVPGAASATELLVRRIGEPITAVTPRGEVAGVLRAADDRAIVIETGAGDQRRLAMLRRDYIQDLRLAAGGSGGGDRPGLAWRLAGARPGKHAIELSYRAGGLRWAADYLAVVDETATRLDFSAWATIKNATGAAFDQAELTLVAAPIAPVAVHGGASLQPPAPRRFAIAAPVRLGAADTVQVELIPPRVGVKARSVIAFEAMPDPGDSVGDESRIDCAALNGATTGSGRAELALELELPASLSLPDGKLRMFRRRADRLELLGEDQLREASGPIRIKLAHAPEITGERRAVTCNVDEKARTLQEKLEVKVDNKSRQAADVVIRELLWRKPGWKLEAEDRKGITVAPQIHEYRVRIPAQGSQTVSYTVLYAW